MGCFLPFVFFIAAVAAPEELDLHKFLEATREVETGVRWNGLPGPRGELSPWQIHPRVWKQHSSEPFGNARDQAKAQAVAEAHVRWIIAGLKRNGRPVTVEAVALAWHAGLEASLNGATTLRQRDHAQRVANLYLVLYYSNSQPS